MHELRRSIDLDLISKEGRFIKNLTNSCRDLLTALSIIVSLSENLYF